MIPSSTSTPTRRTEVKSKQLSRNQYTRDMQRPVAARLEDRYGKRPEAPFQYRVNPDGTIQVVR